MGEQHVLKDEMNDLFHRIMHQREEQDTEKQAGQTTEEQATPSPDLETEEREEIIHVYFVREEAVPEEQVVESTLIESKKAKPLETPQPSSQEKPRQSMLLFSLVFATLCVLVTLGLVILALLPLLAPTATILLTPKEQEITTTAHITATPETPAAGQIKGRLLPPLTLTQTQTAPATGKGHQDATHAVGTITFYNGLFVSQTIAAGTTLTGTDGVQVVTDQVAIIPAAQATTPPTYGQVTVSAHALRTGPQGNIPVRAINQACCLPSVLAQNTATFEGGANKRDYPYVTKEDRDGVVAHLQTTLLQSEHAALAAQITPGEGLVTPTCTPTIITDHQPGGEAIQLTVTVSESCTGVAYESRALQEQATNVLTSEAIQQLGIRYHLIGAIQVSVVYATITDQKQGVASIIVSVDGTWVYQINQQEQQRIGRLVAGKRKQQATILLFRLPGLSQVTIDISGANSGVLPLDPNRIHVLVLYQPT